ncbi:hypothetical protein HNQ57_003550 [Zhongshania antarctica]|uniref:Uncharacterized protein n=1 Tax=Zhongshania antarctica TaxID=641702 RepID=A0A840R8N1_9GAMM|nr:hypothetical protein [Zhongshania antarctica]MBB5189247.1 hypothetical protein [Zhongshania antarctica]
MVKRRTPLATATPRQEPSAEQIEAFASGVDGGTKQLTTVEPDKSLSPKASRDYKAIRVPFNKYEFEALGILATKTGRSKLNTIRHALLRLADEESEQS